MKHKSVLSKRSPWTRVQRTKACSDPRVSTTSRCDHLARALIFMQGCLPCPKLHIQVVAQSPFATRRRSPWTTTHLYPQHECCPSVNQPKRIHTCPPKVKCSKHRSLHESSSLRVNCRHKVSCGKAGHYRSRLARVSKIT